IPSSSASTTIGSPCSMSCIFWCWSSHTSISRSMKQQPGFVTWPSSAFARRSSTTMLANSCRTRCPSQRPGCEQAAGGDVESGFEFVRSANRGVQQGDEVPVDLLGQVTSSLFAQQQVQREATPDVRPRRAQVSEEVGVGTAGVFQSVGQDGEAGRVQVACGVV